MTTLRRSARQHFATLLIAPLHVASQHLASHLAASRRLTALRPTPLLTASQRNALLHNRNA
jgi:hypothetical protein